MYWRGSNPFTSHANRTSWFAASNLVMGAAPERPASRAAQVSSTVFPPGVTSPRPVTTTRRFATGLLAGLLVEILHRIADGAKLLRLFIGDVDVELLLERHHELDGVEAVGAEVLHETGLGQELFPLDAEFLDDDILDLLLGSAHGFLNRVWCCLHDHPAVDHQHLPGDVRREVRAQ